MLGGGDDFMASLFGGSGGPPEQPFSQTALPASASAKDVGGDAEKRDKKRKKSSKADSKSSKHSKKKDKHKHKSKDDRKSKHKKKHHKEKIKRKSSKRHQYDDDDSGSTSGSDEDASHSSDGSSSESEGCDLDDLDAFEKKFMSEPQLSSRADASAPAGRAGADVVVVSGLDARGRPVGRLAGIDTRDLRFECINTHKLK